MLQKIETMNFVTQLLVQLMLFRVSNKPIENKFLHGKFRAFYLYFKKSILTVVKRIAVKCVCNGQSINMHLNLQKALHEIIDKKNFMHETIKKVQECQNQDWNLQRLNTNHCAMVPTIKILLVTDKQSIFSSGIQVESRVLSIMTLCGGDSGLQSR